MMVSMTMIMGVALVIMMGVFGRIVGFRAHSEKFPPQLLEEPLLAKKFVPSRKSRLFEDNFFRKSPTGRKEGLFDIFPMVVHP